VAVNCCVCPVGTLAVDGLTVTETDVCLAWPEFGSIMSEETSTASKSEPTTRRRSPRFVLFQRSSGAPEINHADPLSAIIMPYFFMARRMT